MHLGIFGSFSFIHHVHVAIMHVHGYTCMMSFVNFWVYFIILLTIVLHTPCCHICIYVSCISSIFLLVMLSLKYLLLTFSHRRWTDTYTYATYSMYSTLISFIYLLLPTLITWQKHQDNLVPCTCICHKTSPIHVLSHVAMFFQSPLFFKYLCLNMLNRWQSQTLLCPICQSIQYVHGYMLILWSWTCHGMPI